jgi:hypothetical protein
MSTDLVSKSSQPAAIAFFLSPAMAFRSDLGKKARPALKGYVAPEPGYGDNETISDPN